MITGHKAQHIMQIPPESILHKVLDKTITKEREGS